MERDTQISVAISKDGRKMLRLLAAYEDMSMGAVIDSLIREAFEKKSESETVAS